MAAHADTDYLRGRLTKLESGRGLGIDADDADEIRAALAELDALRARLAEVERERDEARGHARLLERLARREAGPATAVKDGDFHRAKVARRSNAPGDCPAIVRHRLGYVLAMDDRLKIPVLPRAHFDAMIVDEAQYLPRLVPLPLHLGEPGEQRLLPRLCGLELVAPQA